MTATARETPDRFLSLLGLVAWGDLGPLTMYRSHLGRIVSFQKTYPKTPPSLEQLTGRARMLFGAEQWRCFAPYQKEAWRATARKVVPHWTGYDLWIRWWFRSNLDEMIAIMRQAEIRTLDYIYRVRPIIPPKRSIEPHETDPLIHYGATRFGRERICMPPDTTEWLPFAVIHHEFADGETIPTAWHTVGDGTIVGPQPQNNHWTAAAYTSSHNYGDAKVHMHCKWPDGSESFASTEITITTWPL